MQKILFKIFILTALNLMLAACGSFFDKDNTPPPSPLIDFTAEIKIHNLWYTHPGSGAKSAYLKLQPALAENWLFTANKNGTVVASDKTTGQLRWQTNTKTALSSGIAVANNLVYVGTHDGHLLALDQANGQLKWQANSSSEILASPAAKQNIVLVKSIDGHLTAFTAQDGKEIWRYQEAEPNLILRGASAPQLTQAAVIAGFENGNLAKLTLQNGHLQWKTTVAEAEGMFAIQRMVDIDADPIIVGNRVFAATYQGRIAALNFNNGQKLWQHDISSYSGITADANKVYVSDAQGHVWAFDATQGTVIWQQTQLAARILTGPAMLGDYIIVGDAEGYLHWLSKTDGHFVARIFVNHSGILTTPIVEQQNVYVYTQDGHLAAYALG